jgi:signal transduction histidine kinase
VSLTASVVVGVKPNRLVVATATVTASLALTLLVATWSWPMSEHTVVLDVPLHGFGIVCILLGYVAWIRGPYPRIGVITIALGAAYYLQDLRASSNMLIFGIGFSLSFLWTALVAHLALAWPTGHVAGRDGRILLGCCYLAAVSTQVLRVVMDRPHPPVMYDTPYSPTLASRLGSISIVVLTLAVVVVTVRRWLAASELGRRWRAPVWTAVLLVAVPSLAASFASMLHAPVRTENALLLGSLGGAVLLVPAVLYIRSSSARRSRWQLARVVLDPDRADDLKLRPELLQQALAGALGDPSLRVAYPVGESRYADVEGRTLRPALGAAGRSVTRVEHAGELLALIEHDEALHEQQQVAKTVAEVAGVAVEIARMQAHLRAQIERVKTSRLRVAEAAMDERRRIEKDLHDGAQQQFLAVLALLGLARNNLDAVPPEQTAEARAFVHRAHSQLQDAIKSLRELAQGIYPTALKDYGLAAAVEAIADTSPLPVAVVIPASRWSEGVETNAYFLIAEAITNAHKHAAATHIDVHVWEADGQLLIEVCDDGRGGAATKPRTMLDRVNTVGGSLTVRSTAGAGTTVSVRIPLKG